MGVDLTFLPLSERGSTVSRDVLELERRRELWPDMIVLAGAYGTPAPEGFASYYGCDAETTQLAFGPTKRDSYNEKLVMVEAADLLRLRDHEAVRDNPRNRAVWAWLAAVEADLPIVLYWH